MVGVRNGAPPFLPVIHYLSAFIITHEKYSELQLIYAKPYLFCNKDFMNICYLFLFFKHDIRVCMEL